MMMSTADAENSKLGLRTEDKTNHAPDEKKKANSYLDRPVKVKNPPDVDKMILLKAMLKRAKEGYFQWKYQSLKFKYGNMTITVLVILLQIAQVVVIQIPTIATSEKTVLGTMFPAITGGIVALQLKFSWAEKGAKCKKAAKLYAQLIKHLEYRTEMQDAGGVTDDRDMVKLWNAALHSESKDIPAFLACF